MQLDEIKIGWKTLAGILNLVRKAVNSNDPMQGYGISLSRTASGTIISVDPKSDDQSNVTGNGGAIPGKVYIQNTRWMQVALVNPDTCLQSTVYFLASDASGGVTEYDVTANNDGTWTLISN